MSEELAGPLQRKFQLSGVAISGLALACGMAGYLLHLGQWSGKLTQLLADHDRRIVLSEVERKEMRDVMYELKTTLGIVRTQLSSLIDHSRAERLTRERAPGVED